MKKILLTFLAVFLLSSMAFAQTPVYTEKESYRVEVLEDGQIQVRKTTKAYKDGVEISKSFHRHVLAPEDNIDNEVDKVKAIANAVWTEEVITKFIAEKEKQVK